jgi:hypothetical protein
MIKSSSPSLSILPPSHRNHRDERKTGETTTTRVVYYISPARVDGGGGAKRADEGRPTCNRSIMQSTLDEAANHIDWLLLLPSVGPAATSPCPSYMCNNTGARPSSSSAPSSSSSSFPLNIISLLFLPPFFFKF